MCHTRKITKFHQHPKQHIKDRKMAEAKGLSTPVKMKSELAALVGAASLPRTEITKKIWDYIKANKLQTKTVNGKAENAGKYIVCDATLLPIFKNTKSTSKTGKLTDLTGIKVGETIDMMQMAAVVGANIA
jgi:chromatin remodeling complex protein RSC6